MATVTAPASTDGKRRAPTAPPPTTRRQAVARNRGRIGAGALLLAASALLAVAVYSNVGERHPVLAVARTVDPGEVIAADDLTVVRVAADAGVDTVASSERSSVVGQRAAVRLLPGSLLTNAAIADGPTLPPGTSVIGALVKPGQYPLGLRTGDEVQVVVTGSTTTGSSGDATEATIVSISDSSGQDGTAISLAVPASSAGRLAVAGSEGRLLLVLPGP